MRIAGYIQDSIVDGPGLRFTLFVQGCSRRCEGCHNPQALDPGGGNEIAPDEVIKTMLSNPLTDGITLSGGEPFSQPEACLEIAGAACLHGLNVWAYSGMTFEELAKSPDSAEYKLLEICDVLVDGPFMLPLRSLGLKWRGSSNQRVIDVPESLKQKRAVEAAL
ncbi:MAG: anaerobic ribonucleoside-triphosphate reductase activating protein [Oscillospiraceae bacterium]|nr:anaerobic ribonucleoside-triphosphate reductase activating protein [Oscillospiraceae bacterium]